MASVELERLKARLTTRLATWGGLGIEQMRQSWEDLFGAPGGACECVPVDAGGVRAEWISTPGASRERVVLYLHGGGYVLGSINSHRDMIVRLSAACRARVLALDYRLAPEHPHPAAVEDATAAYRWL